MPFDLTRLKSASDARLAKLANTRVSHIDGWMRHRGMPTDWEHTCALPVNPETPNTIRAMYAQWLACYVELWSRR